MIELLHLPWAQWAERERGPSQSVALCLAADHDHERPDACISWIVGVGAGSGPARSQRRTGHLVVGRMASLLLHHGGISNWRQPGIFRIIGKRKTYIACSITRGLFLVSRSGGAVHY